MKQLILSVVLLIICGLKTRAQVIENTLKAVNSLHNVSYTEVLKDKMSFADVPDVETIKAKVTFVAAEKQTGGYYLLKRDSDIDTYDGNKSIWLNLRDSTYKIDKNAITGQATRSLLYWITEMKNWLKAPSKIKYLKDTVIDKVAYNHYVFVQKDTTKKGEHVYSLIYVVSNKSNYLPFSISWRLKDFFDDGALAGWNEEHFYNSYKLNEGDFPDLSESVVPAKFRLPVGRVVPKPLPVGTKAPQINLYDNAGNNFDLEKLKGKMVLLNFTTLGCPHCINAAQMLARLNQKYSGVNFAVVSIYQKGTNTQQAITKFDGKYQVKYPSYLAENTAEAIYHLSGYPNFYLLDKQGVVIQWYEGFYADLENEISDKLNKAL
jgi:thiol-disulfide isomerase/thioredoxin